MNKNRHTYDYHDKSNKDIYRETNKKDVYLRGCLIEEAKEQTRNEHRYNNRSTYLYCNEEYSAGYRDDFRNEILNICLSCRKPFVTSDKDIDEIMMGIHSKEDEHCYDAIESCYLC